MEWCLNPGVLPQLIVAGVLLLISAVGLVVTAYLKKPDKVMLPFAFATILLAGALLGSATSALYPELLASASVLSPC